MEMRKAIFERLENAAFAYGRDIAFALTKGANLTCEDAKDELWKALFYTFQSSNLMGWTSISAAWYDINKFFDLLMDEANFTWSDFLYATDSNGLPLKEE